MDACFVTACSSPADLPLAELAEVAVVGRSNCGKSALINALTQHTKLARTSSTPGRTRQIVFFRVRFPGALPCHLVDLPGYGYARASKREQAGWAPLIDDYIDNRRQLRALLLLCDIRRELAPEEHDLVAWAQRRDIEPLVVLTKADKVAKNRRFPLLQSARRQLDLARAPLACSVHEPQSIATLRQLVIDAADLAER